MFSKVTETLMRQVVENGYKWGCLPYKWDENDPNVVITVDSCKTRKYAWYFNIAFYTAYMICLCGRYLQRRLDDSSQETKLMTEYVLLIYSLTLILRWCIFLRYKELADFINSFLKFFRDLNQLSRRQHQHSKRLRSTKGNKISKSAVCRKMSTDENGSNVNQNHAAAAELEAEEEETQLQWTEEKERLFSIFMTAGLLIRWLDVLNVFTRPEMDHWLTSLLPNPASSPTWQRALLIIPHVYIWWTNWAILNFAGVYGLTYMRATTLTVNYTKGLSEEKVGNNWMVFGKIYRSLQLLQGKQVDALGLIIPAHKVILAFQVIRSLGIVLTVREEGRLVIIVMAVGLAAWTYLHFAFQLFGSIYEESNDCLYQWRGAGSSPRWFRRTWIRSCWCLKIYDGGMYYANRETNLKLDAEIFNKIVEVVLAT